MLDQSMKIRLSVIESYVTSVANLPNVFGTENYEVYSILLTLLRNSLTKKEAKVAARQITYLTETI